MLYMTNSQHSPVLPDMRGNGDSIATSKANKLRTQDIDELIDDDGLLLGLWEQSAAVGKKLESARVVCESNVKVATRLKDEIGKFDAIAAQAKELQLREEETASKWSEVEQVMHSNIKPYTRVGMSSIIDAEINQYKNVADGIETMFLDPQEKSENPIILAKRYVEAKQKVHFRETLRDCI